MSVIVNAHGVGNWVSSVAALAFGDVVASGSCDGFIRLWRVAYQKDLSPLAQIPVVRFPLSWLFPGDPHLTGRRAG